ncbi:MAG: hypothetical protein ACTHK1_12390 [Actinomycetales bacterium]
MSGSSLAVSLGGAAQQAAERVVPGFVEQRVASRLAEGDANLWGEEAQSEASIRLAWTMLPKTSQSLVPRIIELRDRLRSEGVDHVVLCGMGGSSLAPEVITRTARVELTVLDSTDPDYVRAALADRLERSVVVVSSKSGSTLETDSQRRAYEQAFRDAGIDPRGRIVAVTDPGSGLESSATEAGYEVFTADPHVGGRYSALTAFGLVPSGLAGADIQQLLDDAAAVMPDLAADSPDNPALQLGAALGATQPLRDKIVLVDTGSGVVGLGDWTEQLLAESTGKHGRGVLPVVVASPDSLEVASPPNDVLVVRLVGDASDASGLGEAEVAVSGSLGALLLLWETATAVAGIPLGINPFDQPDVESAKAAARGLLDNRPEPTAAAFVDDGIEVRGTPGLLEGVTDLAGAVDALLRQLAQQPDDRGYLAVMAYLDRDADADLAQVREGLARRTGRPVTFGWGPRFLHSTGQYHKGGPATGVYLQITGAPREDLPIPDRPFSFGEVIAAQAQGDADVLAQHGRPVLRLHLTDRATGVPRLLDVLK